VPTQNLRINHTVRTITPRLRGLPYEEMKKAILGSDYDLSLVFVGDTISKRLNSSWRGKDRPTNILSFPLSESSGEIFINLPLCEREVKKSGEKLHTWISKLFIHGLLHLKGMQHGDTMERAEIKFCKKFNLTSK
jgi:probable rRNA maturation factor